MSRDLNKEILELLGFEGEELDAFMPDWQTPLRPSKTAPWKMSTASAL